MITRIVENTGEAHNAPKVGSTITIAKNPSGKGTVVIRKVGEAHPNDRLGIPFLHSLIPHIVATS